MFDFPRSFLFYKDLWDREKSNWLLRKKISHPGFCQGGRFVICREKVFSCLFCFVDMLKPIVTAQCLTGRTASSAGTQCLSRLRRAHSAFRAYGGHAVPSAGTQCLSRLRRSLRKQTEKSLFSAPYGKPYRSKARIFIKATIAAPPHVGNRSIKYRRTQSREFQDWVLAVY